MTPAYSLLPQKALQLAAELMEKGNQEGRKPDEWKELSVEEHLNHALHHINQYLLGERDECHLVNASCRILMASETESLDAQLDELLNYQFDNGTWPSYP